MVNKILVTGVTGNVGSEVAASLKKMGQPFLAAVRNIETARKFLGQGMEYVEFDFSDPGTYETSLNQVNKIFLIRPPQITDINKYIRPVVELAKKKDIKQIVFLSLMGVERNPIVPHNRIEKCILESRIPFTFLRAGFFMQNLNNAHQYDIKKHRDIFIPAGRAKTSFIDTRDIGQAAAKVLVDEGHNNRAYTLTGGESLDYYQAAEIFSLVLKEKVTYSNPSPLKFRQEMIKRGIEPGLANVMVALYLTTRLGMAKKVTADLENLLQRKPTTLEQYVMDYKHFWE